MIIHHMKWLLTLTILSFSLMIPSGYAFSEQNQPNILILNSYHQGEDWTDNEIAGIFSELQAQYPTLVPFVEALDTKRYPSPSHLEFIKAYLLRKYQDRKVDLIIALDNPALDLITQNTADLFPGVPVVFAGINGFSPEMIADRKKITGVIERQDVASTLKMALTMHPNVSRILAVHDYTASGLAVRQETEAALARFEGQLEIRYSADVPFDTLGKELKEIPENSLVLILTYVTDQAGRTFTREESTRLITSLSPAPVYAMHETRLGHGIMGGFLLEGEEHGRQAARLVLRILQGEDPDRIAVEESHSRLILDFDGLYRFRIPEKLWPEDSLVVNQPISYWNRHRNVLIPSIAVILVLLGLLSILLITVIRLHKAKRTLHKSEEKYRVLFDSFPLGITVSDKDGKIVEANAKAATILGVPKEDHVNRLLDGEQWHIIRPDGTPMPSNEYASVRALKEKRLIENIEMGIVTPGAGITWINVTAAPLNLKEFGVVISYGDVTARKRVEEALKAILYELKKSQEVAKVGNWIWYVPQNRVEWSDEMYRIFGIEKDKFSGNLAQLLNDSIHPEDRAKVEHSNASVVQSNTPIPVEYRIVRPDGSIRSVWAEAGELEIDGVGKPLLLRGIVHDITERKQAEKEIIKQLAEKETLLREVHHRVKNNIANIEGLLTIQADSSANPEVKASLGDAISRVQCTRVLYDKLLLSKDYHDISIKTYMESLIASIVMVFDSRKSILIDQQLVDFTISSRKAISVGIIINELLTNIFKYAFKDRDGGKVSVSMEKTEDRVTLIIYDNGIGIDERILADKSPGFGLTLVRMLVEQMDGTYSIVNENGTKSVVQFKV